MLRNKTYYYVDKADYEINWNMKKESLELPKLEKNDIKLFNIK